MAKREVPEINAGSMADIAFLLLIFFLVTTTMDKDQAYKRSIPKLIDVPVEQDPIQKRNILAVRANNKDQLMVRGKIIENPDDISDLVKEFYQANEKKTAEAVIAEGPTNNFPMYSRITMPEIEERIKEAQNSFDIVESTPDADEDIIAFEQSKIDEWKKKKTSLLLLGKDILSEVDKQAHIRVEVQKKTGYVLFTKIHSEIEEAIYELRDAAALSIFNESYGIIVRRYSTDQEAGDKEKIDLLKLLYPGKIIEVTPK